MSTAYNLHTTINILKTKKKPMKQVKKFKFKLQQGTKQNSNVLFIYFYGSNFF